MRGSAARSGQPGIRESSMTPTLYCARSAGKRLYRYPLVRESSMVKMTSALGPCTGDQP